MLILRSDSLPFRLISTLIVKQVTYEDAGHYDCIAIQGKASVKSGANLSVVEGALSVLDILITFL